MSLLVLDGEWVNGQRTVRQTDKQRDKGIGQGRARGRMNVCVFREGQIKLIYIRKIWDDDREINWCELTMWVMAVVIWSD